MLGVTKVSSRTRSAFFRPASTSPNTNSGSVGLAHGQLAFVVVGEVGLGPLDFLDLRGRGRLAGGNDGPDPDVAFDARVRPAGPQADEGVHHVRQALDIELDFLDGFGGGVFVHRADGEDRLSLIDGVAGEAALTEGVGRNPDAHIGHGVGRFRQVVDRHDAFDAGHGEGFGRIDAADVAVRHRAQEQLAEEHAFGAVSSAYLERPVTLATISGV